MKLHDNPRHFIQVVENALAQIYVNPSSIAKERWVNIHMFYTK